MGDGLEIAQKAAGTLLAEDMVRMDDLGIPYDMDEQQEVIALVYRTLEQHDRIAEKLNITELEKELECTVNGVTFVGHVDGMHTDIEGKLWIVEFKMRKVLSDLWYVYFMRQLRWYSYMAKCMGLPIAGFIYDETCHEFPSPLIFTQKGALDRRYTYSVADLEALEERSAGMHPIPEDVWQRARNKDYHARQIIHFTDTDYADIEAEMSNVALRMREAYNTNIYPIRNPNTNRCPGCAFKDICFEPNPAMWLDLYNKWDNPNLTDANSQAN
jgi:hypothetical protein